MRVHDILHSYAEAVHQFYATVRIYYFEGSKGQKSINKHYTLIQQKQEKIQADYNIQCPLPGYIVLDDTCSQSTFADYWNSQRKVSNAFNVLYLSTSNCVTKLDNITSTLKELCKK